jgi:hypothetical protein|tara:strand:- start:39 stop:272 length:234 start_codon:yes stop_codon:yes gene_type:complete
MEKKNEAPEVFEFDAEEIVKAIEGISSAMQKLNSTRLSRKAIVVLIHSHSKVPKKTIEIVLNNLQVMDKTWLKRQTI